MRAWSIGAVLALSAVVGLAGCGGSGGEPLSKADFVKQADAICASAQKKQNEIEFPDVNPDTATDAELDKFADALQEAADLQRDQIDDLKALNPPEEFEDEFGQAMDDLDASMSSVDDAIDASRDGDTAKITAAFTDANAKAESANTHAKALGLKTCGAS